MVFTRWRSAHSSLTVRSSVSSLVARGIGPMRTKPVFRSTTVTTHALPRPCIVSISQSPIRPRLATTAGLCPISFFPASRPRLSLPPIPFSPPLPGPAQMPPQRPAAPLVPPNPTVDRLVAHHSLSRTLAPPNDLFRAEFLPDHDLNGPKLRLPIP